VQVNNNCCQTKHKSNTMSDEALQEAIAKIVDTANGNHGRIPEEPFREALNALSSLQSFDEEQIRSYVASSLRDVTSPCSAGIIAIWLGAGVEDGANPSPQFQPLLDCFLKFTGQVTTDDKGNTQDDNNNELSLGLEFLGQGFVAHLSRDPQNLQALRENAHAVAELERVESFSSGPMWVLELIRKTSGTLIVLHGEQPVGAKVEYRNISNCFHLFTLLQAALKDTMPGAQKVRSDVLAVARGEYPSECSDEAWWHYGQPVQGKPDILTSVFGEYNPEGISSVDGQQVMLLWPSILESRMWDAGFLGPALTSAPSEVELLEMLSPEEIAVWRQRIGLPEVQNKTTTRPWWKFW
jgi:hypothetical protein